MNPIDRTRQRSTLPTFSAETGWRYVYNVETDTYDEVPLTLRDILFPTDNDVDAVRVPQGYAHSVGARQIATVLETYRAASGWLIFSNVLIHWDIPSIPAAAPDIAVIPDGHFPPKGENSYRVGRDGPLPTFVVEITAEETRKIDCGSKTLLYAAVGIPEFLLIDTLSSEGDTWALMGYRLGNSPYYERITPDADGGLTFDGVGLRFLVVDYAEIQVYDAVTGQRLLTPQELKAYADEVATRTST